MLTEPAAVDEDEKFSGVFQTQINSKNYECRGRPVNQGTACSNPPLLNLLKETLL